MQYLLMIYIDEKAAAGIPAEVRDKGTAAYRAYNEALAGAGVLVAGARLRPTADATTVRIADGKTRVLDGPYAEVKEQLGGYYLIEVPDLDAALAWAARCPGAAHGTIEVRPLWPMMAEA